MSQNLKTLNKNEWIDLHSIVLTSNDKLIGHKKTITLKQLDRKDDTEAFLMADIRAHLNGRPTKVGVCLTPFEFDWFSQNLLQRPEESRHLSSKSTLRTLTIKPKTQKGCYEVIQQINDNVRRINLFKKEV